MEVQKNKIMVLVAEMNRINEENQKLKSMLNRMCCRYDYLQKHIMRPLLQQRKGVDGSQTFNLEHRGEDLLRTGSVKVDSGSATSHQSDQGCDGRERGGDEEKKNVKFLGDQLPPSSRKRENRMINSSIQQIEESPNKKLQVLTVAYGQHSVPAAKRIVSVQTSSEESVISDGCQWRKYGQKMTRNNQRPRSYYRCAMAPVCPVKKKVQRCAHDPTIVITTYEGEHTHSLSPLALAAMNASSNQLISEGPQIFVADDQFIPFSTATARISTSTPFPTITLDLTEKQPNRPGLQLQLNN